MSSIRLKPVKWTDESGYAFADLGEFALEVTNNGPRDWVWEVGTGGHGSNFVPFSYGSEDRKFAAKYAAEDALLEYLFNLLEIEEEK